jgi:ABC-type transport system substrate-binding protein
MDNAWDFLNDYYPNNPKADRKIAVTIKVDFKPDGGKNILRIKVRNSNVDNISVFDDLDSVFDYDRWYSTKRYQHEKLV